MQALAAVMRQDYKKIVDSGLILQLDFPDLALSRHMLFSDISDKDFVKIEENHIDVLNYALANLPKEKIRVHICWGNYQGPHIVLFETSNPRHAHEWKVFEEKERCYL